MSIRDWSSDVCSSDLVLLDHLHGNVTHLFNLGVGFAVGSTEQEHLAALRRQFQDHAPDDLQFLLGQYRALLTRRLGDQVHVLQRHVRSEEHTSDLQSLMRISYAVFCLKQTTHRSS